MEKQQITEFKTGAIRDVSIGKSRMDLIPYELIPEDMLDILIADCKEDKPSRDFLLGQIFRSLALIRTGSASMDDIDYLIECSFDLIDDNYLNILYDLGIHYGAGAEKYGDNNFMLGQKLSHIVGSYERHLYKYINNWRDEAPHERGMLWNVLNIKFVMTYYPQDKEICDMLYLYEKGRPNTDFIKENADKK